MKTSILILGGLVAALSTASLGAQNRANSPDRADSPRRGEGPSPARLLERYDADGDGLLSLAELEAFASERGEGLRHGPKGECRCDDAPRGRGGDGQGRGPGRAFAPPPPPAPPAPPPAPEARPFARRGDPAEFLARYDLNGDGVLDGEELEAALGAGNRRN